jgi:hypothetical protein
MEHKDADAGPVVHPRFVVGQWVDVLDTVDQWLEASVLQVSADGGDVYVHYHGWPARWDEWISAASPRIQPFRTRTSHSAWCCCVFCWRCSAAALLLPQLLLAV